ncbi:MAG: universal stress protein [Saprospiraceae bacterium]|nr:universal stress protein [Saprospiraceae bacterium]
MEHIKNILIAVELDNNSEVILEYGITLGVMLDATVKCLHVVRPISNRIPYDADDLPVENYSEFLTEHTDSVDDMVEEGISKLRDMVTKVKKKMEVIEHPISVNVIPDFAVTGILKEAKNSNSDVIILGSHVDYRKKDNAISNLSRKIIDESEQSVIVVPNTYGNRNLDHICVFVNFEFGELDMIQDMIDVVRWNGLHLTFIHVLEEKESSIDVEKKLDTYRRLFLGFDEDPLISFRYVEGELNDIIDDLSNDLEVDLIGLRVKKKAWRIFNLENTFEKKIMNHIRVPLYIWK